MAQGGVAKLEIIPLKENLTEDKTNAKLDKNKKLECQFNPESLTLGKMNRWTHRPDIGDDVPEPVFSGGLAGTLKLELIFDSTDSGEDVTELYLRLFEFAEVVPSKNDDGNGEPRQVMVGWGSFLSPVFVIKSVCHTYTMFKENGTPLRANVSVIFKQAADPKKKGFTNPSSRTDVRRTWVVEKGQRLDWIANEVYGSSGAWRYIAESNGLLNPLALRPGQILKIVPIK